MKYHETPLPGAYRIELDVYADDRGAFMRLFSAPDFAAHDLVSHFAEVTSAVNRQRGTLRGMHYQLPPKAETKLVRCVRGAIYDVVLDLRPGSPSFGKSYGLELTPGNGHALYIPRGLAHGYVTLEDDSEVSYLVDEFHAPDLERGIRWDDPHFAIEWPLSPSVISEKDAARPDFDPAWHLAPAG